MVQLVQMIAERRGIGDLLAEGSFAAAQGIGGDAEDLVVACKGKEYFVVIGWAKRPLSRG